MKQLLLSGIYLMLIASCNIPKIPDQTNNQFADQHFKTAIALVELYNKRYGHYPEKLDSLTFLGDWDKIIYQSVEYERLDNGYRLDAVAGVMPGQAISLNYPKEFWQGLGIKQSNLLNKPR